MPYPWLGRRSLSLAKPTARRQPRTRPGESFRPRLEQLEDLTLLSTAITWTGLGDHSSWTDANNWDLHRVPAAGDDVTLTTANGTTAVTYNGSLGNVSVDSLTTPVNFNLLGGSIATTGGGAVATGGVTLQNGVTFTIDGGAQLVLDGGSQSLAGSGTVVFGASANNAIALEGDVTLTNNVTITGQHGVIGQVFGSPGTQVFYNNGTVAASAGGGTFTLDPDNGQAGGSVINNGSLGGTLTIGSSYTQTAAGSLTLKLTSATTYDTVTVSGTASLAGTIDVVVAPGFTPAQGTQFHVLSFAATANPGDFSVKSGYYLGPARVLTEQFSPGANPTGMTLAVTYALPTFTVQPTDTVAGKPISAPTGVQVSMIDTNGYLVTDDNADPISIILKSDSLTVLATATVTNGVVTFPNLTVTTAGSYYELMAYNPNYGDFRSNLFAITPDVTSQLVFTAQPANASAGATLAPVQVTEEDQYGNVETADNSSAISLTLSPHAAALGGTLSQTVQAGVATFNDLSVDMAGTGYVLTATVGSVSQASAPFNVTDTAGPITWTGLGDHASWTDPNNWDLHRLPGANDDVTLTAANGTTAVTYDGSLGTVPVDSLTAGVNFNLLGGALGITGGGVTLGSGVNLTIDGGAELVFEGGTQSLAGSGTVVFGANAANAIALEGDVTLNNDVTIQGQNGSVGQVFGSGGTQILSNNGIIHASVAGGTITVEPDNGLSGGSVLNNGELGATNGGTLVLDDNVNNTAVAGLTAFGHGSRVLQNGVSITGGVIDTGGAGALQPSNSAANVLDGVILDGFLDMASATSMEGVRDNLYLDNEIITRPILISIDRNSLLYFIGSDSGPAVQQVVQDYSGSPEIVFGASAGNALGLQGNVDLTIGYGVKVHGQNANIGQSVGTPGQQSITLLNSTLGPDVAGGTFTIDPGNGAGTFTNQGSVQATVSGSVADIACTFTNFDGSSTVTGGTFEVGGTIEFAGANIATNAMFLIVEGPTPQILNSTNGANALAHFGGNASNGRLWVRYGSVFTTPGDFVNQGVVYIDSNPIASQFSPAGSYTQSGPAAETDFSSGAVLSPGSGVADFEGGLVEFAGTGVIDANVTNGATIGKPNGGIGKSLTVNGNYTQTAAGNLYVQFSTGSGYNVTVSGTVSLAGTIGVVGDSGAALGNQFHVLGFAPTANPGDFQTKIGYYIGPNKVITEQFSPATNPTSLTLVVTTASLRFTNQPTNTVAGKPIAGPTGVQVAIVDANGVPVQGDNVDQIALSSNMGVLSGGGAVTVVNGVAAFPNLTITAAASGYQLTASNGTYGSLASSAFAIKPDVTAKLVFTAQPAGTGVGVTLAPVVVTEEDQYNNVETGDNGTSISLALSPNPSALNGTTSRTVQAGAATFNNLSVSQTGNGYVLTATAGSVSQASAPFNIATTATTTTAGNATVYAGLPATLTATVSPVGTSTPVNEGTVTFKVFSGATQIGSTTAPAAVSNGHASANFPVPITLEAGAYTIKAYYTPGPDYGASQSDPNANGVLTVINNKIKPPPGGGPFVILPGTPGRGVVPLTATASAGSPPAAAGFAATAAAAQLAGSPNSVSAAEAVAVADEFWRRFGESAGEGSLELPLAIREAI
jgi:hypothetical protein